MGNDESNLKQVGGTAEMEVKRIENTGTFRSDLHLREGKHVIELRAGGLSAVLPYRDGEIVPLPFEQSDAGRAVGN